MYQSLNEPVSKKSKKDSSLKFLSRLIAKTKEFKNYYIQREKQTVSWKDHMIAICQEWIFDGNLTYAIPFNIESLNWCAGHGNKDIVFDVSLNKFKLD